MASDIGQSSKEYLGVRGRDTGIAMAFTLDSITKEQTWQGSVNNRT